MAETGSDVCKLVLIPNCCIMMADLLRFVPSEYPSTYIDRLARNRRSWQMASSWVFGGGENSRSHHSLAMITGDSHIEESGSWRAGVLYGAIVARRVSHHTRLTLVIGCGSGGGGDVLPCNPSRSLDYYERKQTELDTPSYIDHINGHLKLSVLKNDMAS